MLANIAKTMSDHHRQCDALFGQSETAALEERWAHAEQMHARFCQAMDAHLAAEETILFPVFESTTGMTEGPTQVMRAEHAQMREIIEQLTQSLAQRQPERYADLAEMLLILMQQHNLKEENILYPMCDRSLAQRSDEVVRRLVQVLTPQ
jgi:hemerythrin-like domain-containing protein